MEKHVSKKDQLEILIAGIREATNRNNVDYVLPLLDWTITKIDLITKAKEKQKAAKQAKQEGKKNPNPALLVSRGEIWEAYLGVNVGSEQSESRPVLIIQNETNNRRSPNTIIAPLSKLENRNNKDGDFTEEELKIINSKLRATEVLLRKDDVRDGQKPLANPSIVLFQNIRDISKERLRFKITHIEDYKWLELNAAIKSSLGLDSDDTQSYNTDTHTRDLPDKTVVDTNVNR